MPNTDAPSTHPNTDAPTFDAAELTRARASAILCAALARALLTALASHASRSVAASVAEDAAHALRAWVAANALAFLARTVVAPRVEGRDASATEAAARSAGVNASLAAALGALAPQTPHTEAARAAVGAVVALATGSTAEDCASPGLCLRHPRIAEAHAAPLLAVCDAWSDAASAESLAASPAAPRASRDAT